MLETLEDNVSCSRVIDWSEVVARVCSRIPPLWDLSNFVAVNPFLGFSSEHWTVAAKKISDGLQAAVFPPIDFYRRRWNQGAFSEVELTAVARRYGEEPARFLRIVNGLEPAPTRPPGGTLSLAELHDLAYGTNWNQTLNRSISQWCAVFADQGGAFWNLQPEGQSLYSLWRQAAQCDRTLQIAGLKRWCQWAAGLPVSASTAIDQTLSQLGVDIDDAERYLYRMLGGLYGWASFFRRFSWQTEGGTCDPLIDLLAIRLCADAAVAELAPKKSARRIPRQIPRIEDESAVAVLQEALEDGYVKQLIAKFRAPEVDTPRPRPAVQAVFCIDVRSEPFRRQLEAQSESVETLGFAGFFGVALDWNWAFDHSARCPVLVKPSVRVCTSDPKTPRNFTSAIKHLQGAPAVSFSLVETLGIGYGIRLAKDSIKRRSPRQTAESTAPLQFGIDGMQPGITTEARLKLAEAILTNMGLRERFARLVLLCGHESLSTNNPHAASLDCGACGGHSGSINARVAAALLNDLAIREGLQRRGIHVPRDTWFIPGVHNTTTDEVTLLDVASVPQGHREDISTLNTWLARAAERNRQQRAASLGLAPQTPQKLASRLLNRAGDWSEVRPEWGLAGNAAFIAARRPRTRGVDLQGRAFLHEYDWRLDADGSVLGMILSAPMVVASWINLQYFASTVDNKVFGSGTKALHNRVGSLGVVLGNGGDLRTGLPMQSVHSPDGSWYHEPLRLQVIAEAPRDRIDQVLDAQPSVGELVENGWVRLFALEPDGNGVYRSLSAGVWEAC